jgi:hypothetical protein
VTGSALFAFEWPAIAGLVLLAPSFAYAGFIHLSKGKCPGGWAADTMSRAWFSCTGRAAPRIVQEAFQPWYRAIRSIDHGRRRWDLLTFHVLFFRKIGRRASFRSRGNMGPQAEGPLQRPAGNLVCPRPSLSLAIAATHPP